jgi:hypothetical protein
LPHFSTLNTYLFLREEKKGRSKVGKGGKWARVKDGKRKWVRMGKRGKCEENRKGLRVGEKVKGW